MKKVLMVVLALLMLCVAAFAFAEEEKVDLTAAAEAAGLRFDGIYVQFYVNYMNKPYSDYAAVIRFSPDGKMLQRNFGETTRDNLIKWIGRLSFEDNDESIRNYTITDDEIVYQNNGREYKLQIEGETLRSLTQSYKTSADGDDFTHFVYTFIPFDEIGAVSSSSEERSETSSQSANTAGTSSMAAVQAKLQAMLSDGLDDLFKNVNYKRTPTVEGFSAGVPDGDIETGGTWMEMETSGSEIAHEVLVIDGYTVGQLGYVVIPNSLFAEDPEMARVVYQDFGNDKDWNVTYVDIEEHPALVATYENNSGNKCGAILYYRNNQQFMVILTMAVGTPTWDNMITLANQITYDESQASVRAAQVALNVTVENNAAYVSAGQSLKFTATFADPDFVNAKAKNNRVSWTVFDVSGDEPGATIDAKGVLKVKKTIEEPREIGVIAISDTYGSFGMATVTLLPQVKTVNIEPSAVTLFAVEGAEETVAVSLDPSSVPLRELTWTPNAKNIVEIEDHGDGTATIKALKAGKVTITVKESGGKTGKFTVTVQQPVEALDLSAKGKAIPGKTVTMSAKLTPANASDKTLTWALDVDEGIATISPKGQVKIGKDAPVGTVITVSCTAEGAPQPIVSTMELEVVEK